MTVLPHRALLLLSTGLLAACDVQAGGQDSDEDRTEAAAREDAADGHEPADRDDGVADADDEEVPAEAAHVCQPIADRMQTQAQVVLETLSVEHADFDGWWSGQIRFFLKSCEENLSEDQRECVLAADDPLAVEGICGVPELAPAKRPRAPDLSRVWRSEPPALSEEQGAAILSKLAGTWRSSYAPAKEETTWKIAADGAMTYHLKRRDKVEESERKLILRQEQRLHLDNLKGSTQPWIFAQVADDRFYASGNLLYGAHPAPDRDTFQIFSRSMAIAYDRGKCSVFSGGGARGEASCELTSDREGDLFKVAYTLPTHLGSDGEPREQEASFRRYDDVLVDTRMQRFSLR
ncbi:MAG: hypothetical protein EA397_00985 [Deltaproteobacteria bacterium]|nr:MAG: hypothetical protein EA397_00985 [Deltaproteobacteria bacterium]